MPALHPTGFKSRGGGVLNKLLFGEAPPGGSNPYPLIYQFYQHGSPFIYLKDKPKQWNFLDRHVLPGLSVVLNELCSHFCQNVALFDILRFSHHFTSTLQRIFRILKFQYFYPFIYCEKMWLCKKAPLSGGASPYGPL